MQVLVIQNPRFRIRLVYSDFYNVNVNVLRYNIGKYMQILIHVHIHTLVYII